jgi:hypothetical protein
MYPLFIISIIKIKPGKDYHFIDNSLQTDYSLFVMATKVAYIWDYDIDEEKFKDILSGKLTIGRLDKEWATLRLFEYAPYKEIVRLLDYRGIVERWPGLKGRIRSQGRKRGFDFLVEWLKTRHPERL